MTPKLALLPQPDTEVVPPPIPNWESASASTSWPDEPGEHASAPVRGPEPVHAAAAPPQERPRRSRAFTTTLVLGGLLVAFLAVTIVMVLLHNSGDATPGPTSTAVVVSHDASQLKTATQSVHTDISTARSKLLALHGIPTIAKVTAVMNPYVSSLQHYERVLSGVPVPKPARGAAASVRALVSKDVQSLGTINGLAPLGLGSYLEQFGTGAAKLQKELGTLEHALRAPTR